MSIHKILPFLAAALLVSCSQRSTKLQVSARGSIGPAAAAAGSLIVNDQISIDRVRIAVQELELEDATCTPPAMASAGAMSSGPGGSSGGSSGPGGGSSGGGGDAADPEDPDDDADECEVETGPFVADLAGDQLAGGIHPVFQAPVPAGTFRELEVRIGALAATVPGAADLAGSSVVVNGSFTHQVTTGGTTATVTDPFTISVAASVEIERETQITVAADGSVPNVTLAIDWAKWFTDGTRALDPTNPADAAVIAANIASSLDAFEDDDQDGMDDEAEGGGD